MKLSRLASFIGIALMATACTNSTQTAQHSLEQTQANYQQYEDITKQYQVNEQWWLGYQDAQLTQLINQALENNKDLALSAIAVNKALYQANYIGADLVPTFSGSTSSSAAKGVGSTSNINSTGHSSLSHGLEFSLSYTLDLWRRLADSASAAEWTHKATIEDLKKARLTLINAVVNTYYQLAYLQDAINVTEQSIKNYEQISRIQTNKLNAGAVDRLTVEQAQQATLNARNSLISLRTNKKVAEQTLRNLLNLQPNQPLVARYPSILKVKLQGIDTNVPVSSIANRPDVVAALQRLQSAFKSLSATEKNWFPSVTLGGKLSSQATKAHETLDNPVGTGLISVNMPFLDWERVKNNVKISETDYLTALTNYEQTITKALNEIDNSYYAYQQAKNSFATLQQTYQHDKRITQYYKNRYEQGASEFKDWLAAMNTERSSELTILNTKYTILTNENAVYQAMAGKYSR